MRESIISGALKELHGCAQLKATLVGRGEPVTATKSGVNTEISQEALSRKEEMEGQNDCPKMATTVLDADKY